MYALLKTAVFAASLQQAIASPALIRRGETPAYTTDASTTPYCTWWYDNVGATNCKLIAEQNNATLEDFIRWNPIVDVNCRNFRRFQSYCVQANNEPIATPSPTQPTVTPTPSPTTPSNGIETPQPIQPGMVSNCNAFYLQQPGEYCLDISSKFGLTLAQFTAWNTGVGSDCTLMWPDVYFCVGIIGFTPPPPTSAPTPTPTPTTPGNGITTPLPTQPGMVSNCNKFYLQQPGEYCSDIAAKFGISLSQFTTWNTGVGSACQSMWADVHFCVGVVGFTATPTPSARPTSTRPGNGVATPTPIQSGMVGNCRTFTFVQRGETCAQVLQRTGVTLARFFALNPAVRADCSGLWSETWACVATL